MFYVNIIETCRNIVAICDSEILGKKFEEGNLQLDAKESFYKGELKNEEETSQIIQSMAKEDATFNIIGKKSTALAIKENIISKENVKTINGMPYALILA
ncbi:DUF424 family protein [Candidatus Pacearchaeota archaeon]|nr:DUF424 family protein [Candidatus Pacearchaeota archaeon]